MGAHAAAPPSRPNVFFLMADQLRFNALSAAGNRIVETPHLDRLAREGAHFEQATCSTPLCGPSRASLITGMFQHGRRRPGNAEVHEPGMPEEAETWDEILVRNGYHAEYHGKWHAGSANRTCYADGRPYYLNLYHDYLVERYPGRTRREDEAIDRYTKRPYRYLPVDRMMLQALRQGLSMPHHNEAGEHAAKAEDSLTAWIAGRAIRFLKSAPKQPFTLTLLLSASARSAYPRAPLLRPLRSQEDADAARAGRRVHPEGEGRHPQGADAHAGGHGRVHCALLGAGEGTGRLGGAAARRARRGGPRG